MAGPMPKMTWQTREIAPLGLTLDFLAGPAISEGVFEGVTYLIQSAGPLLLGVWYGAKQDLTTFRTGFGPQEPVTFGPEEEVRIGSQCAWRQVGTVAAGATAIGLVQGPDGLLGHISSSSIGVTHVVVAMPRRNLGVLIKWQVDTAERVTYQAAETHFFQAITCK
jgi:hypothetical protein